LKKLLDYRVVVIDRDGNVEKYPLFGFGMHQDCFDNFSKKKGYDYSNRDDLVRNGNALFCNAGNNMLIVFLPSVLTDEQLYAIDYIENFLDDVFYMEVSKGSGEDKTIYIFGDNIRKNFSENVIQSYYVMNKKR